MSFNKSGFEVHYVAFCLPSNKSGFEVHYFFKYSICILTKSQLNKLKNSICIIFPAQLLYKQWKVNAISNLPQQCAQGILVLIMLCVNLVGMSKAKAVLKILWLLGDGNWWGFLQSCLHILVHGISLVNEEPIKNSLCGNWQRWRIHFIK